ncbi:hypothetical protein [Methylotenera sp.]|uniref:hypothetical protein n=1 Tax=Methylotenera sp. TaxID=2051956 RepID=UPI0024893416|nr:hypothetical protein [Methylotenera sp.]MDI1297737.1 hypothetical protein [Methylotenera sp.]
MKHLQTLFIFSLLLTTSVAYAQALPKDILTQLPKSYEVMSSLGGELNDDNLTDYLVVTHIKNEEAIFKKTGVSSPRPLYIFIQNQNKTFSIAKKNDDVVFAIDQGGQCDPFEDGMDGLVIKNKFFTVQNSVACGEHWNDFVTFKYDVKLKDWIFHKHTFQSFNFADLTNSNDEFAENKLHITKANPKKVVTFEAYQPH